MTVLAPDPRKDLPKLMNYLSLQPAKIMGINKLKGSIEVGKHADFFIFDPNDNHNHTDCFNQYPDLCIYLNQPL